MRSKPYKRTKKANAKYYIDYYETKNGSKRRVSRSTGSSDYQTAMQILKVKQSDAAKAKFELTDPAAERMKKEALRPIEEHIAEYVEEIASCGAGSHHLQVTQSALERFAKHCKQKTWGQVTEDDATRFIAHLRKEGLSQGTIGNYRRLLKSFSKRMYESRKALSDNLLGIKRLRTQQRVMRRGVLTRSQFAKLFSSVDGTWRRTIAADRKLAYCLATRCGLRAGEICQLTEHSFNLSSKNPFLSLREDQTKNKKAAKLFLGEKLCQQVKEYYAAGNTLDRLPHKHQLQKMLWSDMDNAGLPRENKSGERIDFHALRHTCGFWLVCEGVNIKTVQAIMRHSNISLTLDTYGHLLEGAESQAIDATEHLLPI